MSSPKKSNIHVHPHTKKLARHLRFTPNDLLYNRHGQLSSSQMRKVRRWAVQSFLVYIVVIIVLIVLVSIVMITPWAQEMIRDGLFSNFPQLDLVDWTLLIASIVVLIVFMFMLRKIYLSRKNINQKQVQRYIGYANREEIDFVNRASYRDNKYFHYITVDGRRFEVDSELFKLCQKNFIYCVYVAPAFDNIISMEVADASLKDVPDWMIDSLDNDYIPNSLNTTLK